MVIGAADQDDGEDRHHHGIQRCHEFQILHVGLLYRMSARRLPTGPYGNSNTLFVVSLL